MKMSISLLTPQDHNGHSSKYFWNSYSIKFDLLYVSVYGESKQLNSITLNNLTFCEHDLSLYIQSIGENYENHEARYPTEQIAPITARA